MGLKTVYCFTNLINNKKYVGSTIVEPNVRYNQHIYNATHESAHQYNYPLYQAIRKYGLENFKFSILEQRECSEEEIRKIEQDYIISLNTLSPNGYNQTLDTLHPINNEETYKKIRETKRENAKRVAEIDDNYNILKVWRSIIDCAEDTGLNAKKIDSCCLGLRKTTGERKFCWINEDNKLEIPEYKRDFYKGETGTTQIQKSSRKVAKIDLKTNEVIETYDTIALASRENNCDASAISKVCNGKRNKCAGYKWQYLDTVND